MNTTKENYIKDNFFSINPYSEYRVNEMFQYLDLNTRYRILTEICRDAIKEMKDKGIYKY